MNASVEAVARRLWYKCVLVYGASWVAGLVLFVWLGLTFGYAISKRLENVDPAQISAMEPFLTLAYSALFGGALGATVGLLQSFFFHRHLGAGGWVFVSAVGGALSVLVSYSLSDLFSHSTMTVQGYWEAGLLVPRTAFSAALQGSVGLLQWFVLRRRVHWAWEWIPACWLGGAVGGAVGLGVDIALLRYSGAGFGAGMFISLLVGGLIAGPVLAWLFQHPKSSDLNTPVPANVEA